MLAKNKKLILFACLLVILLPQVILAGSNPPLKILDEVGNETGPYNKPADSRTAILSIVGTVINIGLGLIGVLFLGLMIFAGYNWMTAQGEEEKVTKAKQIITRSIIGIAIVVGSYAAWYFLFSRLF